MIEINPYLVGKHRFLGIQIFLPKCTLRLLLNMKIICLDESFDLKSIEKKCSVPLVLCPRGPFDQMIMKKCLDVSASALKTGISSEMCVKEAIQCVFQNE